MMWFPWLCSVGVAFCAGALFENQHARKMLRFVFCPTCHGKGQIDDGDSMPCPTCGERAK